MEFFGIIFYIVIFAILASVKKAARFNGENASPKTWKDIPTKGNLTKPNVSSKGTEISSVPNQRKETILDASTQWKEAIPNVPTQGKVATPNVPSKGRSAIPNTPRKKRYTPVFMEPHKEERNQPQIRNNNLWGEDEHASSRIVALRLMEGDPVPEGYERIKCPYCAADNLVTKHCKQYHSCYSCRVPID